MKTRTPKEYKVVALRDCPMPDAMALCDTPNAAAKYWLENVATEPRYNPDVENMVVLMTNTRRRLIGHVYVSTGTLDTLLIHPREIFRAAIVSNASAIILIHNHPSGESSPSEADIKVTRDLYRCGRLLKIEVLDHIIIGNGQRTSLRELGYFMN